MIDAAVLPFLEAAGSWKRGLGSRESLIAEASELIAAGRSEPSMLAIASLYSDAGASEIDELIAQVTYELGASEIVERNLDLLAARRLCRLVIAGEMDERELTGWAHRQFGHESEVALLDDLVLLDDDWDDAVGGWGMHSINELRLQVRAAAQGILDCPLA